MEKEVERSPLELSEDEKRKYLFLKQINTLNAFRERNAISKEQYDISYNGLVTKMEITDKELKEWLDPSKYDVPNAKNRKIQSIVCFEVSDG